MLSLHRRLSLITFFTLLAGTLPIQSQPLPDSACDIVFTALPDRWIEGLPLGNGLLGAMVWQKGGNLRFSLDRSDLWDLRTIPEFELNEYAYSWVYQRWLEKSQYMTVQQLFDTPYARDLPPVRLPAGALEIPLEGMGRVAEARLSLREAACRITWEGGVSLLALVHASQPAGYFRITGLKREITPGLVARNYRADPGTSGEPAAPGYETLNYPDPVITRKPAGMVIRQEGRDGAWFETALQWEYRDGTLQGWWTVNTHYPGDPPAGPAAGVTASLAKKGERDFLQTHRLWWAAFWKQSEITLPDKVIERQWYREMYKLGSASGMGAPAAARQAVWTEDTDGRPAIKNDYHNVLHTQMTYWPVYTANHLLEGSILTDWLWNYRPVAEKFTKRYFGAEGLNFPGICTMNAYPLGGTMAVSHSTTVGAWLSQHMYWQWKYSMDRRFLQERAYPFVKDAAFFLENMAVILPDSMRYFLMSSSPGMYGDSRESWFRKNTSYDISLAHFLFKSAAEMAGELGLSSEKNRWEKDLSQFPQLSISEETFEILPAAGHTLALSLPYFGHLMAFYPLGLLDAFRTPEEKTILTYSLDQLERLGTENWRGFSYPWFAALQARAGEGNKARSALQAFITSFCLPNSLHAGGRRNAQDRTPDTVSVFSIEGNMGYAAALQEMLLQSHHGVIRVFPAVPWDWDAASFTRLRTEGAFLVSASRARGRTSKVQVLSEKGGTLRIEHPFAEATLVISGITGYRLEGNQVVCETKPGQLITFTPQ